MTHENTIEQLIALLGVLVRAPNPDQSFVDREKDRHTVLDILGWLWDTVTGPVLTSLDHINRLPPDATWPRIWWCPTGPLTLLPLYAASHHHRHQQPDNPATTDTVPDWVVSSPTPSMPPSPPPAHPTPITPPHALHHAVAALRAKYPTEPLVWARYLHRPVRVRGLNRRGDLELFPAGVRRRRGAMPGLRPAQQVSCDVHRLASGSRVARSTHRSPCS